VGTSDIPNIIRRRKSLAPPILGVIAGAAAAIVALAITRAPGPGLSPDSASYVSAAEFVARGQGYRISIAPWHSPDSTAPLAHFPPGYPTAIALPLSLGLPPLQSARWVNATAAFLDLALVVEMVALAAGEVAAVLLAIALLVMPAFLEVHLDVLSEPLFLACLAATLAAMFGAARAMDPRRRLVWFFASGCAAAAAVMVRYAGAAVCAAACLWALLLPGALRDRLRRAALTVAPSVLFTAAWVIRTHLAGGVHTIRRIGAYGDFWGTLREGVATIVRWLVPLSSDETLPARGWIALIVLAALTLVIGRGGAVVRRLTTERSSTPPPRSRHEHGVAAATLLAAASLLSLCYAIVLVLSRLLADPDIPFDERILSPLFVLAAIIAAVTLRYWWRMSRKLPRVLGAVLVLAWLAASYHVTSDEIEYDLDVGHDLAEVPWRTSPLLAWTKTKPAAEPLYSNWPAAIVLHLHRSAHELPEDSSATTLRALAEILRANHGVVLSFDTPSPATIDGRVLIRAPGFRRVAQLPDGSVFVAAP
jgi:hypothetical protein